MYLEYAPKGFVKKASDVPDNDAINDDHQKDGDSKEQVLEQQQRQIFVKNLNFDTREEQLQQVFQECFTGKSKDEKVKAVTIIRKADTGQSRGYGFVEMSTEAAAKKAVKRLQNFLLDDHAIKLSLSTKAITETEQQQKKDKVLKKRKANEMTPTEEADMENEEV